MLVHLSAPPRLGQSQKCILSSFQSAAWFFLAHSFNTSPLLSNKSNQLPSLIPPLQCPSHWSPCLMTASSRSYHLILTRARPSYLISCTPVFPKLSCTFSSSSWSTAFMLLPNLEIHHVLTASQLCVSSSWIFNRFHLLHLAKVLFFLNLHLSKCQL